MDGAEWLDGAEWSDGADRAGTRVRTAANSRSKAKAEQARPSERMWSIPHRRRPYPPCPPHQGTKKRSPYRTPLRGSNFSRDYSSKSLSQPSEISPPALKPPDGAPSATPKKPYLDNVGFSYEIRSLCFIFIPSTKLILKIRFNSKLFQQFVTTAKKAFFSVTH